ncbi:unnamed protein product [Citrullus colocynthis]|uniref:Uncharacterized protein n=1 Tax=Citrullus colocynthis TaxID=252529 RepID=A0ABP0YZD7_9ROSI
MALLFALELRQAKRPESLVAAAEASLDVDSDGNAEQLEEVDGKKDLEAAATEVGETSSNNKPFYQSLFNPLIGKVLLKLATNPNSCSCILGLAWALVAKR